MPADAQDQMRFEAFGTGAVVVVADPARGALERAVAAVELLVAEFDRACSRFRSDSELSLLNASGGSPMQVGPVLLDAVTAGLRAARLTGGDVDPTVGGALIALGYDRDFGEMRDRDFGEIRDRDGREIRDGDGGEIRDRDVGEIRESAAARPVASIPGWRTVQVDMAGSTIRTVPGVILDLGATAKALAADRAAAAARDAAGCGVLVSFGGDLAIAGPPPADGWRVRVTDDHRAGLDAPGQWISLRSGGLATSSVSARQWRTAAGGVAHHLVDPATGRSADGVWRTVSVTAASCLDANIASTAAIIRGSRAVEWLAGLGLPSRLVGVDGTVRHLAGWPAAGDDLRTPGPAVALA